MVRGMEGPPSCGGAGWTRTTDNAIMSRALYHLSYGTAERDASERLGRPPSACSSFSGAWRWRLAFSCSWPRTRAGGGLEITLFAALGFYTTTFWRLARPPATV